MPLSNEVVYELKGKRLQIKDPELNLNIDEAFDPLILPENPLWGHEVAPNYFVTGNVGATEFYVEGNGRPHGQCLLFFSSRKKKGEMYYAEGKLHGPATYFDENGQVLSKSWYVHGRQQGRCHWYYPDGKLYSLQRYKDGQYQGKQEYYHADGRVKTVITYDKGVLRDVFLAEKQGTEKC